MASLPSLVTKNMASSTAQVFTPPLTPRPSSNKLHDTNIPIDIDIPDNYVHHVLATQKELPPITWKNFHNELQWISIIALTFTPLASLYGWFTTPLQLKTALFSIAYYYFTGLGITAGYHRLWAHRSYNASRPLEYLLALAGAGAVQGSIKWWSRGHRAHHRYTDTDLDPYGAHHGLIWSHIGWMVVKPRRKPGVADISDLTRNPIVRWQHDRFIWLIFLMGITVPTVIPGYFWGDWRGGYFYAALTRLLFVHHVSSLAE
jgi:stearoyl-CoA desaturase (delta-9 desaturase)